MKIYRAIRRFRGAPTGSRVFVLGEDLLASVIRQKLVEKIEEKKQKAKKIKKGDF